MKKLALIMAILMIVGALATACGPKENDPAVSGEPQTQDPGTAAEPARDTINVSIGQILTTLDPHRINSTDCERVLHQVFDGLYWQNEATGEYEPRLAESYTISDDGLVYTFTLRENATFHNGDPVLASDVVFSINRAKEHPEVSWCVESVTDAQVIDDRNVAVSFGAPNAAAINNICWLMIASEKNVTEQGDAYGTNTELWGTGPYKLIELDADVEWTLEAYEDYYRGPANIKYVHYTPITDSAAAVIAFESGDLDWLTVPEANWAQISANTNYNSELVDSNSVQYLGVNPLGTNLGDINVRKAINHCVNKENYVMGVASGLAVTAEFMVPAGKNAGAPDTGITYGYDLEKAKEYMAAAGYPDGGLDVGTILCVSGSYSEKMAQMLQQDLAVIGITAQIERLEGAAYVDRLMSLQFDIMVSGFAYTGDYNYLRMYMFPPCLDYSGTTTYEEVMGYFDAADQEMDPVKRIELNKITNDAISSTGVFVPVLYDAKAYAWSKDINVVNYGNFPQIYEWSWAN